MARFLVILLLPVLALWSPVGGCCVFETCGTGGDASPARTAHHAPATPSGCAACEHGETPPTEPGQPAGEAPATPAIPNHDTCTCNRTAAQAPAEREAVAPSVTHAHLLPALDLWIALPYTIDPDATGRPAGFERDAGPPASPLRSLLAQACLLTI